MLAGCVTTSSSVLAAINVIKTHDVRSYTTLLLMGQVLGCALYVAYEIPINAYAAAIWTSVSATAWIIISYFKCKEMNWI